MHDSPDTPDSDPPRGPYPWGGPPDADADPASGPEPGTEPEAEAEAEQAWPPPEPAPDPPIDSRAADTGAAPPSPTERRLWAVSCHLSPLLFGMIGMPFLGPLGSLIVWQMKRDDLEEVDDQGREALNFQLNVLFWTGILFVTCIGAILIPVLHVGAVVLAIVATVKTFDGERYRYPGILRVVRPPATVDDLADAADAADATGGEAAQPTAGGSENKYT